ncbi:hypothetical protein NE237_018454 [Protea cynaroides]|uniref:AAA+ ATPase domain-containing protein n=1 Tax=Protea cynaroides TaxID=273540 RepID=A0A9Q0KA07_9MAGN|nr:hypothetical protein NE237_018454 [Protea cynaroides]
MDIVIGAITEVVKYLVSPFMNHVSYLVHYKRNVNDLREPMTRLGEMKADVQRSIDAARMRREVIKIVVEGWLTRVNEMQSKEMTLNNTLEQSKGCLQGGCSVHYQVGKDAKEMIDQVKDLLNEGRTFIVVSDPAPLPPSLETMQMLEFQVYDSTKLAMDQIMEALKREDVNMVGVYGLGGVGKTTLMKHMAKILKRDKVFYHVVMVTVSQNPAWTKIQGEIAENLGLPLTQESLSMRARLLLDKLKEEKQMLIVLDDLWNSVNLLEQIGIPYGNNCKVVLTTRRLEVCIQMETQFNVELKVLSEGDAWILFKWAVGDLIQNDNTLLPKAKQIVRECGGLPLAIVTIGRALRAKDQSVWNDAASQLMKKSSSPPDIEGMHEKVFCSIELSYNYLASEDTKFCFLLCCMFPEDFSISENDLLPYVVGEGVFRGIDSLMEARNRLHTHMERLKWSCLLFDDSRRTGSVRMHDIIRDVSIWIASKEGRDFVVKSGRELTQFQDRDEELGKCKRLSLMQNKITHLPNLLDCSQLVTLSLRDNHDLREIPDDFFQGMKSLKTLDLKRTNICSIPSSLSSLMNLRVLLFSNSAASEGNPPLDVSLLGKLKKLQILHIFQSNVEKLPEEIGELSNLKSLNLGDNKNLTIAPNILSRLSLLEELYLKNSFHAWEMEGRSSEDDKAGSSSSKAAACLSEVASLSALSLTTLEIRVSNIKCLSAINIPFHWENLTCFVVVFGRAVDRDEYYCNTNVAFSGVSIPQFSDRERIYLMERAERLDLRQCRGLKYILSVGARGLNNLRVLYVHMCDGIDEYILSCTTTFVVDEATEVPQIAFSRLERLNLQDLPKLKAICNSHGSRGRGGGGGGCFNNLRFLRLWSCSSLITIIPSDLLAKLPNLEELEVFECPGAIEVFNSEGLEQTQTAIMSKLKRLELIILTSLRTIWQGVVSPLSFMNLECIFLYELRLKILFPLAMAQRLQQLKRLSISECKEMVEIISMDEGNENRVQGISSSSTLHYFNPASTYINNPSSSSSLLRPTPIFGNLRFLGVYFCDSLKHILPMSLAEGLLQLEELDIKMCPNLEEIIVNDRDCHDDIEEKKTIFPRLRDLELIELPNISMVSKGILLRRHDYYWPSLETLKVFGCSNLERLPVNLEMAPKLREMKVEEEWFNGLGWPDHDDDHQTDEDNEQFHLHRLRERGVKILGLGNKSGFLLPGAWCYSSLLCLGSCAPAMPPIFVSWKSSAGERAVGNGAFCFLSSLERGAEIVPIGSCMAAGIDE